MKRLFPFIVVVIVVVIIVVVVIAIAIVVIVLVVVIIVVIVVVVVVVVVVVSSHISAWSSSIVGTIWSALLYPTTSLVASWVFWSFKCLLYPSPLPHPGSAPSPGGPKDILKFLIVLFIFLSVLDVYCRLCLSYC